MNSRTKAHSLRIGFLRFGIAVILLLAVFDGVRDTFAGTIPLGVVRDLLTIAVAIGALFLDMQRRSLSLSKYDVALLLILLVLILQLIITTVGSPLSLEGKFDELKYGPMGVMFKPIDLFAVTFLFSRYMRLVPFQDGFIERTFVILVFTLCLLTFLFASGLLNTDIVFEKWRGRVSIGYPTVDAILAVLAIGLISQCRFGNMVSILLLAVFIVFLILQNTFSGYLAFLAVCGLQSYFAKRTSVRLAALFGALIFIAGAVFIYFYRDVAPAGFGDILVSKIDAFILGVAEDTSYTLRQEEIESGYLVVGRDLTTMLFGGGVLGIYWVENTYIGVPLGVGIFGSVFLGSLWIVVIIAGFGAARRGYSCNINSAAILSVSFLSLAALYMFGLVVAIAYCLAKSSCFLQHEASLEVG